MFGRKKHTPSSTLPQAKKKSKDPILGPVALITWILLLGSIFVMAVIMNMGINMVVTTGYIFLSFGAMCAGFLFLIAMKTPGLVFLKAFLYGKTITEVRTKDGRIVFVLGHYAQGSVKSKFGSFYVNPDAVKNESRTGKGIIHIVDSIGTALTEKFVMFMNTMRNKYGCKNIEEVEDMMRRWSKCEECNIEGVPLLKLEKKTIKDEEGNKKDIEEWREVCMKCGNPDKLKRKTLPPLYYNTMQALDYGIGDQFFKFNVNPDRQEVIIEQEVKNRMAKEKRDVVKIIGIIAAIGFAVMLSLVGISILLTTWPNFAASMASSPPPMVG